MRPVLAAALLFLSTPALAGPICVVDLQKAVSETKEGKAAQKRLDGMFSSKRADLARMETNLQAAVKDYEGRRDILSPTARADEEQKLLQQQQQLQQSAAQAEAEMQQTYVGMLGELDKKLR
ncbi:MAG: OmpH family outer membrane protein, partial [Myxococcota bacterium]